jgi:hypothetical protein
MLPSLTSSLMSSTSPPKSEFLTNLLDNTQKINDALSYLDSKLINLCGKQSNDYLIRQIFHAFLTFTLNVKSYLASYVGKVSPTTQFSLPNNPPILFPPTLTDEALKNVFFNLLKINLDPIELRFLILSIENEKTFLIHTLQAFLPATIKVPRLLKLNDLDVQDSRNRTTMKYADHPEFAPSP